MEGFFTVLCLIAFLGSIVGFFVTFDPIYFAVFAYMTLDGTKG